MLSTSLFGIAVIFLCVYGLIPVEAIFQDRLSGSKLWALSVELLIVAIGVGTLCRTAYVLAVLSVEADFSSDVAEASQNEISSAILGRLRPPISLKKVPEMWPTASDSSLASLRMCKAIQTDAFDRQFGSKEILLQYYREESNSALDSIANQQKVVLHLGILGTFFGLVFAMPALARLGNRDSENMGFFELFSSLEVCFSTSITGLIVSVFISVLATQVMKQQSLFFKSLEEAAGALLVVVRNAHHRNDLAPTFHQLKDGINQTNQKITSQNVRLENQTQAIQKGMQGLIALQADLKSFLSEVGRLKTQIHESVDTTLDYVSSDKFLGSFEMHVSKTAENVSASVESEAKRLIGCFETSRDAMEKVASALTLGTDAMCTQLEGYSRDSERSRAAYSKLEDQVAQNFDALGISVTERFESVGAAVSTKLESVFQQAESATTKEAQRLATIHGQFSKLQKDQAAVFEKTVAIQKGLIHSTSESEARRNQQETQFLAKLEALLKAQDVANVLQDGNAKTNETIRQGIKALSQEIRSVEVGEELVKAAEALQDAANGLTQKSDKHIAPPRTNGQGPPNVGWWPWKRARNTSKKR